MKNEVFRSVTGRDFPDDAFGAVLEDLHLDGVEWGLSHSPPDDWKRRAIFNPELLEYVRYISFIYRHHCPYRQWESEVIVKAVFEDRFDETKNLGDKDGGIDAILSAAILFCSDRSLVSYLRGQDDDAVHWFCSARRISRSLDAVIKAWNDSGKASEKMTMLNLARHQQNCAARERVVSEWEKSPSTWSSAEKAGLYFADLLTREGVTYEPRTVTGWIRAHAKLKEIRFR